MITSVLIIVFSVILLIYWFRYCCILLLRAHAEQQTAGRPACGAQFSFSSVREHLTAEFQLDALRRSLDRDYALFAYLLEHAAGLGATSLEEYLLRIDYKVMLWSYRLTRTAAPE
jgi:hypothetical protein